MSEPIKINHVQAKHTLGDHTDAIHCVAIQNNIIWCSSRDGTIRGWDIHTGFPLYMLNSRTPRTYVIDMAVDGDRLWYISKQRVFITCYNVTTGEYTFIDPAHREPINNIKIYRGRLWSCSDDKTICCWDTDTRQFILRLTPSWGSFNSMDFHGDILWTTTTRGKIQSWDIHTGHNWASFTSGADVFSTTVIYKGMLWSAQSRGDIVSWDIGTGEHPVTLKYNFITANMIKVHNDELWSGYFNGDIVCWDVESREPRLTLKNHQTIVTGIYMTPDFIWSASFDNTICQWNYAGECLHSIPNQEVLWRNVVVHQNQLWSCGKDHKLRGWIPNATINIRANYDLFPPAEQRQICELVWMLTHYMAADLAMEIFPHMVARKS